MSQRPLDVLLLEPFPSTRWVSIIRYCDAISSHSPFAQVEISTAIAPWWNPPSLIDGVKRHWTAQSALRSSHDIVHLGDQALGHHVGRFAGIPTVVTCHDIMPFVVDGFYRQRTMGAVKRLLLKRSIAGMLKAARLICVSQHTANDVSRRFDYPGSRISIVPNMVGDDFTPTADARAQLATAGITLPTGPLILSVGHGGGYKNLDTLFAALATPELKDVTIIRVGGRLWPRQIQRAQELGVADRIVQLGRVSNANLVLACSACDLLAQPSIYEGFGVPVIEAMACGLPVVASDGGALPEVIADAGLVVPCARTGPASISALAEAIAGVLGNAPLRADLRERGLKRAELYRPATVLPQLADAYRRTAGS